MNSEQVLQIYQNSLNLYSNKLSQAKKKSRTLAIIRGLVFICGFLLSVFLFKYGLTIFILTIIFSLIILLFFVAKNIKNNNKIKYLNEFISLIKKELKALEYDFSEFDAGLEFINPEHKFTYDLDIFGRNSIFQTINRTCTFRGKNILSEWFKNPSEEAKVIINRQNAIKDLENKTEWKLNFLTIGNLYKEDFDNSNDVLLKDASEYFYKNSFYNIIRYVFPAITVITLILVIFNVLPVSLFGLLYFAQFGLIGINLKKSNEIHQKISKKVNLFTKYELLLKEIENLDINSELISNLKEKIKTSNLTASVQIGKLKRLSKGFDNRLNLAFTLFAQGIFLWDLQYAIGIEKWQSENKESIDKWFEVIGEIDALISLSSFSFNNPNYNFPEVQSNGNYIFEMRNGGHPLIKKDILVKNNFLINKQGFITIVTGANMAGKSTFLRTVGVNLILSMIGSKVNAEKLIFKPIKLFTSIRTSDSIQKSESYFYAELKRLKSIIEELKTNENLFVIIDEMLRGTNSKDKHLGSEAMIKRLFSLNSVGIVATHDINLGKLIEEYPENIQNKRFEVDIKDDELFFDYKIKDGISQNLNATFLMKKMEIIV